MIISRRAGTTVTALALVGVVIVAPFVPPAAASWLGVAAMALTVLYLCVDMKSPTAIALGHLGAVASCFALGVHDEHRTVWVTLLATFAALPLAWALQGRQRAVRATGGLVLGALTFGVFAWSTEQLDNGPLSSMPDLLLLGTGAGIVMIVRAVHRTKRSPAPTAIQPERPTKPALPSWARDVTKPGPHTPA